MILRYWDPGIREEERSTGHRFGSQNHYESVYVDDKKKINIFFSFKMLSPNLLTIQSIKNKKY